MEYLSNSSFYFFYNTGGIGQLAGIGAGLGMNQDVGVGDLFGNGVFHFFRLFVGFMDIQFPANKQMKIQIFFVAGKTGRNLW